MAHFLRFSLAALHLLRDVSGKTPVSYRFPKKCSKCGKIYHSPDAFLSETDELVENSNDICYQIAGKTRIFRYRNCKKPCMSTLVVTSEERRDSSPGGLEKRRLFQNLESSLKNSFPGLSCKARHDGLLYLFRLIILEGFKPDEAHELLIQDLDSGSFQGFVNEPKVAVEQFKQKRTV